MKTQPATKKTDTFEDLIFEGRNKSYGAFELNQKRNRYLLTAFLISFTGIATTVAVPFINSINADPVLRLDYGSTPVDLINVNTKNDIPVPPPMPDIEKIEKSMITNLAPKVVEEADEEIPLLPIEELLDKPLNKPPDVDPIPIIPDKTVIPEDEYEKPVDFPTEPPSFLGGDINYFRKWVSERTKYPAEAAEANIFGKVIIEFCVNRKGEVVEIKVLRSLHPSVDEATIKVISSSPKWTPAKQGGNPVKTRFIIPFVFDLI